MKDKVLVIDCGTQSTRALVFDRTGKLLLKEKIEYTPYYSTYPGYAEQDPRVYWNTMIECCRVLKEENTEIWSEIKAVTVTTIRDTLVFLDDKGEVVRDSMLWLDQRMAKCSDSLPILDEMKIKVVGMKRAAMISRRKSKCNWIRENERDNWDRTKKVMLLTGYFYFKLAGKYVDSISSQVGHIPFDYKRLQWIKNEKHYKWALFGVDKERLPELRDSGEIIGEINSMVSGETGIPEGTKIILSGTDKGCETIGTGCIDEGSASISFGTTATIQTTSNSYCEPIQFMPAYPSVMKNHFNPEVEIFRGYWMISWFKRELAQREVMEAKERGISPESILNELLNEVPPGSQGLILQPYWGPGLKTPDAKGAIIGFGDVHTRSHIYRAIIEGINFALIEGAQFIENKTHREIKKVFVSGGGSQSDTICQITADMFGKKVYKGETYEACGLGAAICAFVGMGYYKDYNEAVGAMVRHSKVFKPNEEHNEIYSRLFNEVYKSIYPKLKSIYRDIQRITKYPEIFYEEEEVGE